MSGKQRRNIRLVSDNVATAIGSVIAHWAMLEKCLASCVWKELGIDHEKGHCITANLSVTNTRDIFLSLLRLRLSDNKAATKFSQNFDEIQRKRNLLAHNFPIDGNIIYGRENLPVIFNKITARGIRKDQKYVFTIEEMNDLVGEINDLTMQLIEMSPGN